MSAECQVQCLVIHGSCHLTLTNPLRGKNNYQPHFTGEEASSEGFGAWLKVTQVGTGRAGTWWMLQGDLGNTQTPPARGRAVTMGDRDPETQG